MELSFSSGRAAVAADGMMRDLIHRWKYHRAVWLEPFFANLLAQAMKQVEMTQGTQGKRPVLVPVPLHPLKEREREFNQAEHLALRVGQLLALPAIRRAVIRHAATESQTRLTRAQRNANMRRAFAPGRNVQSVRGRRVILIDDVLTTGATTSACAAILLAAGAEEVCVWTLARGLLQ